MTYNDKYIAVKEFIEDNFDDVTELVAFLSITVEDVVNVFPDKLVENYEKIFADESEDSGTGAEGEDEESYDPFED